jgi:hypothetical protein
MATSAQWSDKTSVAIQDGETTASWGTNLIANSYLSSLMLFVFWFKQSKPIN